MTKMNILERVQNIRDAEAALGIHFCSKSEYILSLPDGSKLFGAAEQFMFCFVDGYQETVFVWDSKTGIIKPIAYDFSEFLRLIFACGSGYELACIAMHYQSESGDRLKQRQASLRRIQTFLGLTPIEDPEAYMKIVGQVIDCSKII